MIEIEYSSQILMSGKLRVCDGKVACGGDVIPPPPDGGGGGSLTVTANPVIHLTSALLDPIVPDALRYTHSMEANSISLQAIATIPIPPLNETTVPLTSSADSDPKGAVVLGEREELVGGGANAGDMVGRTEWKLTIHPPLAFVNTLPCALEIELTQSCSEAPQVSPPSGRVATKHEHSGGDGGHATRSSGRGERVDSFEGAKDLFFLPDIVQATNGGQATVSVESEASRREVKIAAANAFASAGNDKLQGSDDDLPLKLRPVWCGVVGVGKKVKVGPLARNQLVFLRVRLSGVSGGGQGLGHSWSDPEVLYPAERDSREAFNSEPPHCITWKRAAADHGMNESENEIEVEEKKGATTTKVDYKDELFMAGAQWGGNKCLRIPRVSEKRLRL